MRRGTGRSLAAGLALLIGAASLPAAAAAVAAEWPAWTPETGGEFRTAAYDAGEWTYRNGIGQNLGPNVDGLYREDYFASLVAGPTLPQDDRDDVYRHLTYGAFGFDRSTHNGDYELPRDRTTWPDFTADLAVLRARIVGDDLFLRYRFTSMPRPDAQIATLTFATEGALPAPTAWPNEAGVTSPWTAALTLWGSDGQLDDATGARSLAAVGAEITADVATRTWEVRVPLATLPTGPWRLTGGAGLADPTEPSRYWDVPSGRASQSAPGSGVNGTSDANVWTLLFAETDDWQHDERYQSDLLVDGDVSAASTVLDPAMLRSGATSQETARTGRLSRFHVSTADLGDGIGRSAGEAPAWPAPFVPPPGVDLRDPGVSYTYRNDLQPSQLYVPAACQDARCPLLVFLHGLNNFPYEPFGLFLGLEELLEERGYLFVSVLGRGDLSYEEAGELDVLEVIADVSATYDVDPQRIHINGMSMGSIGSHYLATRHPDLFASVSGYTLSSSASLLPNLRHVDHLISHGRQDFFDPNGQQTAPTYNTLSGLGYDTVYYDWFSKTHEAATYYDIATELFDRFDAAVAPTAPAEITFVRPASGDFEAEHAITPDRAYWLTDITPVAGGPTGRVDARSYGIGGAPLDAGNAQRTSVEDAGLGLPSGRGAHTLNTTVPAYGSPAPLENRLELTLQALTSLEVAAQRAGLVIDGLTVDLASTDAATLTFTDATGTETATLDGSPHPVRHANGVVVVDVPAGEHVLVFEGEPTVTDPAPDPTGGPALPTTGGGLALLGLLGLVGARTLRRP